jgi:hypothetical protein
MSLVILLEKKVQVKPKNIDTSLIMMEMSRRKARIMLSQKKISLNDDNELSTNKQRARKMFQHKETNMTWVT